MRRFAKTLLTTSSRRLAPRQSIGRCVAFFSSEAPQLGNRLTPEQIAERRAKRAQRRGDTAPQAQPEALFIEGSVRPYQRHYVVVEAQGKDPMSWPAKLEMSPEHVVGDYVKEIAQYFNGNIKKSPLLVTAAIPYTGACEGVVEHVETLGDKQVEEGTHDILVFPELVRVHNVTPSKISTLTTKSLEKGFDLLALLEEEGLQYSPLDEGYHMMVCGHGSRDERCGCKGPELLQWLKTAAPQANKPLHLWISSHYGGHRYAAACIAYPSGDWFGLLNDEDKATSLLDAVNDEDPLRIYELWRGRMGLTHAEMHQAVKDRAESPQAMAGNA